MSSSTSPLEVSTSSLASFTPTRILSETTSTGSIYVLGTLHDLPTIIHLQKTVLESEKVGEVLRGLERLNVFLENQPYFSTHAWLKPTPDRSPDLQIKIICPASETHIKKYSQQERWMVVETPEVYERVVLGYIDGFDESRLGWVYAILDGKKEADRILYRKQGEDGFVILPDLKWDQTSMNALYLTVLVQTRSIRSLRDLTPSHIPLLNSIKQAVYTTVKEKFGVGSNKLRLFVHYQPSYYHFHVHVVHIEAEPASGMLVGQAHMLDDLITLLELSPSSGPSILAQKTYTYPLGAEHGLFEGMKAVGAITFD
ncbi:hypothetical protein I302_107036 [Kwoniella bestiolae CBS 10118]|uniref:Scavenger mRNA-decapping enzyme DcpS n=1 Tax=Kwoniella bestiolae CBS 10118 TaxID=1296100 RepID=A0A1B9FZP8_9TREE|nr:hypothetical protein I302_05699 [Kwoniella bestiolae CBS 10118]OCF24240.1 hypothetical protein I302_05699 [Kwoniella bestiolae CBS 10118]